MTKLDARFIGPEIPMGERAEIIRNQSRAASLKDVAGLFDPGRGGRWARPSPEPLKEVPRQPGYWANADTAVEPPLGMTTPNQGEVSFAAYARHPDPASISDPSGIGLGGAQDGNAPGPQPSQRPTASLSPVGPEGDRAPEISPCGLSSSAVALNSERPTDSIPLSDGPRPALSGSPSRIDARASLSPGDAEKLGRLEEYAKRRIGFLYNEQKRSVGRPNESAPDSLRPIRRL
jgi:hypothetical protein